MIRIKHPIFLHDRPVACIPHIPPEERPRTPLEDCFKRWRKSLTKVVAAALPFASTDDTRSGLNQIQVESDGDGGLIFIATDGHTAAVLAVDFPLPHGIDGGEVGLTRDGMVEYVKSMGYAPPRVVEQVELFPAIREVLKPGQVEPALVSVRLEYVARVSASLKKLGVGKAQETSINTSGELGPVLLVAKECTLGSGPTGIKVAPLFVVMPMRESDSEDAAPEDVDPDQVPMPSAPRRLEPAGEDPVRSDAPSNDTPTQRAPA